MISLFDRKYLEKHRISFWKISKDLYRVYQHLEDPQALMNDRIELGTIFHDRYRSCWVFISINGNIRPYGVGDTRSEAIEYVYQFER